MKPRSGCRLTMANVFLMPLHLLIFSLLRSLNMIRPGVNDETFTDLLSCPLDPVHRNVPVADCKCDARQGDKASTITEKALRCRDLRGGLQEVTSCPSKAQSADSFSQKP